MFEDSRLLLRALADLAEGLRETALVQRSQQDFLARQLGHFRDNLVQAQANAESSSRESHPTNAKWRTWRGFVQDLQALQSRVPRTDKVTKTRLGMLGPDSARTITRTMACYGLAATDWPPSTWDPDENRVYRPQKHA